MYERLTPRWGKEVGERKKEKKKKKQCTSGSEGGVTLLDWGGGRKTESTWEAGAPQLVACAESLQVD